MVAAKVVAAKVVAAKEVRSSKNNAGVILLGGIVALYLLKAGAMKIFEPIKTVAEGTVYAADQLTGGLQGDPKTFSYWSEFDVPFSDVQVPLAPGLQKKPEETWGDYFAVIDIPGGGPSYDFRDVPGDIKELFKKVL